CRRTGWVHPEVEMRQRQALRVHIVLIVLVALLASSLPAMAGPTHFGGPWNFTHGPITCRFDGAHYPDGGIARGRTRDDNGNCVIDTVDCNYGLPGSSPSVMSAPTFSDLRASTVLRTIGRERSARLRDRPVSSLRADSRGKSVPHAQHAASP